MYAGRFALAAALLALIAGCSPQSAKAPETASAPPASVDPNPAAAPQTSDRPPTVGGLYIAKEACPGEGCYLMGRIRAYEPADLYDKAGAGAVVAGKVQAGDWVDILEREEHLAPLRGVVREGRRHFDRGDVVYLLTSQGEGCYDVWDKHGAVQDWCDPEAFDPEMNEPIDFDPPAPKPEGAGLWVKVKAGGGAEGWLKGVNDFACTGYQDRDADCPPLPQ